MKAIERLFQYFDFKNIKPTRFEKDYGLSNGYLSIQLKRKADIGSGIIEIIVNNCRDLNIEWLITGEGNMLNSSKQENIEDSKIITSLKETIKEKDQEIKLLNREIGKLETIIDDYKKKIHNVPQKDKNNITLK